MWDKPASRTVTSISKSEGKAGAIAEFRDRIMLIRLIMSPSRAAASFVNHAHTHRTYYTYTVITFYDANGFL